LDLDKFITEKFNKLMQKGGQEDLGIGTTNFSYFSELKALRPHTPLPTLIFSQALGTL
jgi:hypothetical protein